MNAPGRRVPPLAQLAKGIAASTKRDRRPAAGSSREASNAGKPVEGLWWAPPPLGKRELQSRELDSRTGGFLPMGMVRKWGIT